MVVLVSKCLLGENCRYDGNNNKNEKVIEFLKGKTVIAVCPEELGGLPTPRDPAEIKGGEVVLKSGGIVTDRCRIGAQKVLFIAKESHVDLCILKEKSPSCGSGVIYDGTFTRTPAKGDGIAAAALKKEGIKVVGESEV